MESYTKLGMFSVEHQVFFSLLMSFTHNCGGSLFKRYCTNFYCSSMWVNYPRYVYKKVRSAYNSILCIKEVRDTSYLMVLCNVNVFDVIFLENCHLVV